MIVGTVHHPRRQLLWLLLSLRLITVDPPLHSELLVLIRWRVLLLSYARKFHMLRLFVLLRSCCIRLRVHEFRDIALVIFANDHLRSIATVWITAAPCNHVIVLSSTCGGWLIAEHHLHFSMACAAAILRLGWHLSSRLHVMMLIVSRWFVASSCFVVCCRVAARTITMIHDDSLCVLMTWLE